MQDDLIERLRATRYTERWPGFCTDRAINPDGPEAADRIAALEAKLAEKDALLRECGQTLRAWDTWEGRLLMDDRAWQAETGAIIPQDLFDAYVEGPQSLRATTLTKIKDATDAD